MILEMIFLEPKKWALFLKVKYLQNKAEPSNQNKAFRSMFRSKESERFWQLLEALDAPVTGWEPIGIQSYGFFSGPRKILKMKWMIAIFKNFDYVFVFYSEHTFGWKNAVDDFRLSCSDHHLGSISPLNGGLVRELGFPLFQGNLCWSSMVHPRRLTARTWSHDGLVQMIFSSSRGVVSSQVPYVHLPGCKLARWLGRQAPKTSWWFQIFSFHPYLGKIPILTNIFQLGWNHQREKDGSEFPQVLGRGETTPSASSLVTCEYRTDWCTLAALMVCGCVCPLVSLGRIQIYPPGN